MNLMIWALKEIKMPFDSFHCVVRTFINILCRHWIVKGRKLKRRYRRKCRTITIEMYLKWNAIYFKREKKKKVKSAKCLLTFGTLIFSQTHIIQCPVHLAFQFFFFAQVSDYSMLLSILCYCAARMVLQNVN